MIYLDNAATTKPLLTVLDAMDKTAKEFFYNPSSHHFGGYEAKRLLHDTRKQFAELLGAREEEIYFTSGGSESNNWALTIHSNNCKQNRKTHIICSTIEHHSVLNKVKQLEKEGFEVTYINPNSCGRVEIDTIINAVKPNTGLIILMAVNNELGTIQPYKEIGKFCKERKIYFHVDAVQAIPHLLFNLKSLNISTLSLSAHKFHGPRGAGALYIQKGINKIPLIYGGNQESGYRAGTENLPAIVGMEVALEQTNLALANLANIDLRDKFDYFIKKLKEIPNCIINNDNNVPKVNTIISFYFPNVLGEVMLSMLNQAGIYASAGAACAAGDDKPSHVLKAIGLSDSQAKNTIRLSFDYNNTYEDIDYTIEKIKDIVSFLDKY